MSKKIKFLLQSNEGIENKLNCTSKQDPVRQNVSRRRSTHRLKMQKIKNIKNLIEINLNERLNDQNLHTPVQQNVGSKFFSETKTNEADKYISKIFESIEFKEQRDEEKSNPLIDPVKKCTDNSLPGLKKINRKQRVNKIKHLIEPGKIDHSKKLISKIFQNIDVKAPPVSKPDNKVNVPEKIYFKTQTTTGTNQNNSIENEVSKVELIIGQPAIMIKPIVISQPAISAIMIR